MKRSFATLAGIATLATVPASAKADSRSILAAVNYERQMAGIAPIVADSDLNASCSAHAAYMAGAGVLGHDESPGASLFSQDGAWAGNHSVLARSSEGFFGDPWKSAPFHEFQVLHPWLRTTGIGVSGDYACMVTLGDRDAPNPSEISLITSPAAGQYYRPAEYARELPFTPGEELGIPQGTKTGPHIYVYALGPEHFKTVTIQSATLTAADDGTEAPIKWVDGSSARSGPYLDGGAILIPTSPLKEGTTYGLRVEAATTNSDGQRLLISRTTSFITGPDESDVAPQAASNDTVTASRSLPQAETKRKTSKIASRPTVLGAGDAQLIVSLKWSHHHHGLRARIRCQSDGARCEGPLRILVRRKGHRVQKLRFVARGGPLKVDLAANRTIVRRLKLTGRQRSSGKKRGFAVRWGGPRPQLAKAYALSE